MASASSFVGYVSELAVAAGHYPAIRLRGTKLTITTRTDEVGGVSQKDFDLVELIDHR